METGERLAELSARIDRLRAEVASEVAEPWRAGLLGIFEQLALAIETSSASIEIGRNLIAVARRLTYTQLSSLRRTILPGRPDDASEAAVYDRKADLIRLLDLQPSGPPLVESVQDLAWEAIRDRDDLTLHCLASGPLDFYFRARRMDHAALRDGILDLRGKAQEARALRWFTGPAGVAALAIEVERALAEAAEEAPSDLDGAESWPGDTPSWPEG